MVSTRPKNKGTHPAAPVMTAAAKQKVGIPVKRRAKKVTKDDTIRELKARIASLESPGGEPFSKEPLVCNLIIVSSPGANDTKFLKGESPSLMETDDHLPEDPEPTTEATEIDSDDGVPTGYKRNASSSVQDPR